MSAPITPVPRDDDAGEPSLIRRMISGLQAISTALMQPNIGALVSEVDDTPLDTFDKWFEFDAASVDISAARDWDENIKKRPGLGQLEKINMFLARWSPRLEFLSLIPERQGSLDMQYSMNKRAAEQIKQRRPVRMARL